MAELKPCPYGVTVQDKVVEIDQLKRLCDELGDALRAYKESQTPPHHIYGKPVTDCHKFGEWIPVSERLPEKSGKYLVAGRQFHEQTYQVWICEFLSLGLLRGWSNNARNPIVEMWMHLPQPPKGE